MESLFRLVFFFFLYNEPDVLLVVPLENSDLIAKM